MGSSFLSIAMTIRFVLLILSIFSNISRGQDSPWLLTTPELPSDYSNPKFMPTLGNGQLSVTPYLGLDPEVPPSITANCLYNGDSWNSHRARIPNYSNYKLMLSNPNLREEYTLDLQKAEFLANFESDDFQVSHQVLVHRLYTRTIVNVVTGSSKHDADSSLTVDIALEVGQQSEDITNTETAELYI